MDLAAFTALFEWLQNHPAWATAIIFLLAFGEGLVVAGVVVPGATLLFLAGALVGSGYLDLWPSLTAAFAGAFLGDSVSFWLGRHFGDRLRGYWPLSRFPGALAKGESFFYAHGGKSIFLGRFVGPVRGIIPAVAGMLAMPGRRFMVVNLVSALAWAPAYLLPGVVFGASLGLAASVTTRLIAVIVLALLIGWAGVWTLRNLIAPPLHRFGALWAWRTRRWGRGHPAAARALYAPRQALRALGHEVGRYWWVAVVLLGLLAFRQFLLGGPTLPDEALLGLIQARLEVETRALFVLPALLLDPVAWVPAWLVGVGWTAFKGRWRVALVLLLAVPGAAGVAALLGVVTGSFGQVPLYRGAPLTRFPSPSVAAFATMTLAAGVFATAGYGRMRRPMLILALALLALVAMAAVVVGRVWLLDAVAGVLVGTVAAGLVVFARSGSMVRSPEQVLPGLLAAVLAVAVVIKGVAVYPEARAGFVEESHWPALSVQEWLEVDPFHPLGRELRWFDGGRRVVDVQWLVHREPMAERLAAGGWVETDRRLEGVLRWLQAEPELEAMLPPPRWHRGRLPALIRVLPLDGDGRRLVLRMWPAPMDIVDHPGGVWLVSLEHEQVRPGWPLVRISSRRARPGEVGVVVGTMLGSEDIRIMVPGQPIRILPDEAVKGASKQRSGAGVQSTEWPSPGFSYAPSLLAPAR